MARPSTISSQDSATATKAFTEYLARLSWSARRKTYLHKAWAELLRHCPHLVAHLTKDSLFSEAAKAFEAYHNSEKPKFPTVSLGMALAIANTAAGRRTNHFDFELPASPWHAQAFTKAPVLSAGEWQQLIGLVAKLPTSPSKKLINVMLLTGVPSYILKALEVDQVRTYLNQMVYRGKQKSYRVISLGPKGFGLFTEVAAFKGDRTISELVDEATQMLSRLVKQVDPETRGRRTSASQRVSSTWAARMVLAGMPPEAAANNIGLDARNAWYLRSLRQKTRDYLVRTYGHVPKHFVGFVDA